jgi:hydroxymethylpyrimidine/phosphomethylpyrimidine kinase
MRAAKDLQGMGAKAVLVKGGHLPGEVVVDVYLGADKVIKVFKSPRIHSLNVHGTGCTLSSAIAAGLAKGQSMELSLTHARAFIAQAIEGAREVKTGGRSSPYAHGPLNHGFGPVVMVKAPL